jgi:hypothetical protein
MTISPATAVAISMVSWAVTNLPMMRRWQVSQMSGTMANGRRATELQAHHQIVACGRLEDKQVASVAVGRF